MELRLAAAHHWCLPRKEEEGNKRQMPFPSSRCSTVPGVPTGGAGMGAACLPAHRQPCNRGPWGGLCMFLGVSVLLRPLWVLPGGPCASQDRGSLQGWAPKRAWGEGSRQDVSGQGRVSWQEGTSLPAASPLPRRHALPGVLSCSSTPCPALTPAPPRSSHISQSVSLVPHDTGGREWGQTLHGMLRVAKGDVEGHIPGMEGAGPRGE